MSLGTWRRLWRRRWRRLLVSIVLFIRNFFEIDMMIRWWRGRPAVRSGPFVGLGLRIEFHVGDRRWRWRRLLMSIVLFIRNFFEIDMMIRWWRRRPAIRSGPFIWVGLGIELDVRCWWWRRWSAVGSRTFIRIWFRVEFDMSYGWWGRRRLLVSFVFWVSDNFEIDVVVWWWRRWPAVGSRTFIGSWFGVKFDPGHWGR